MIDPANREVSSVAEKIAQALAEADRSFGYEIKLIRLVDGESTYRLTMDGDVTEHPDYDEAAELMQARRDRTRAELILAALTAGEEGELEHLREENARLVREWEGRERADARFRARWGTDELFKRIDHLRRQLAGIRPGDVEDIAELQSRCLIAETELASLGRTPTDTEAADEVRRAKGLEIDP